MCVASLSGGRVALRWRTRGKNKRAQARKVVQMMKTIHENGGCLNQQVAIITGASSGISLAVARALLAEDAQYEPATGWT